MKTDLQIFASSPCRVDFGGTLDISTFHYPLHHLQPATVNIALEMRTKVRILPYRKRKIKISSKGFEPVELVLQEAPYQHPLGFMFAICAFFNVDGIHVEIESMSPPRSGLGGSSVAGVALAKALSIYRNRPLSTKDAAIITQSIEASVAGVPCGMQDQLAAAYGGVNMWYWAVGRQSRDFARIKLLSANEYVQLEKCLLVAYCGIPHESKDINGTWVRQFLMGGTYKKWEKIVHYTHQFASAISAGDMKTAARMMNLETEIRREMTPNVIEKTGSRLIDAALSENCGARFTGAGGGGCLWAIGPKEAIAKLKPKWQKELASNKKGLLLPSTIARKGLVATIV